VVGAAQPLTADGSRALITTNSGSDISGYQTHLSVVDTATGALIGTTLTVSGSGAGPLLSADGSRAVVVTQSYSWYTGLRTTRVAVFDTTSGEQVGKTRTLGGYANLAQVSGADGTHALVATSIWNPVTLTTSSRVLLIDTVTGHKLGALTIAGDPWLPWVSADGTRAVLATDVRYLWNLHASNTGVVVLQIA
jgi:DNA-binding beta-propeller fold protein YncE